VNCELKSKASSNRFPRNEAVHRSISFNLNDARKSFPLFDSTELPDDDSARAHAAQVARISGEKPRAETVRVCLAVRDTQGRCVFEYVCSAQDEAIPDCALVVSSC